MMASRTFSHHPNKAHYMLSVLTPFKTFYVTVFKNTYFSTDIIIFKFFHGFKRHEWNLWFIVKLLDWNFKLIEMSNGIQMTMF